ncbi:hypothetical protein GCM10027589_05460 [Actinocorallia lasiicapitis]
MYEEWMAQVRELRLRGGSISEVAQALDEHARRGDGSRIGLANAFRKEYGFSLTQACDLINWAEDGVTSDGIHTSLAERWASGTGSPGQGCCRRIINGQLARAITGY